MATVSKIRTARGNVWNKRTKFRESSKEEEIPAGQNCSTSSDSRSASTEIGQTTFHDEVLQLFKEGVLNDRVDNKDESWRNASPECGNAILSKDMFYRFNNPEAFDDGT